MFQQIGVLLGVPMIVPDVVVFGLLALAGVFAWFHQRLHVPGLVLVFFPIGL